MIENVHVTSQCSSLNQRQAGLERNPMCVNFSVYYRANVSVYNIYIKHAPYRVSVDRSCIFNDTGQLLRII